METKITYVRLPEDLDKRVEKIRQEVPGAKSTVLRFLVEKAVAEYERRKATGTQAWFADAAVAQPQM